MVLFNYYEYVFFSSLLLNILKLLFFAYGKKKFTAVLKHLNYCTLHLEFRLYLVAKLLMILLYCRVFFIRYG